MGYIPEYAGDIFAVPEGSVLIHACNCIGEWGSGFAAALKAKFPAAYEVYRDKCLTPDNIQTKKKLLGTAMLIQPQAEDVEQSGRYWIACLFTSRQYGAKKDKPEVILENTKLALASLTNKLQKANDANPSAALFNKLFAVRINAKGFKTPWFATRAVLIQSKLDIWVINNLKVMGKTDRKEVDNSMRELGFDPTVPPPLPKKELISSDWSSSLDSAHST